jgi:uncharacterized membrane protein
MADAIEPLPAETGPDATTRDEERILRYWTPILLRSILIVATIILACGLVLMATQAPGAYLARFRAVQAGRVYTQDPWHKMFAQAEQGDPHAIVIFGLMVLTLVPLARVAFCFLLFIRERDWTYVAFTANVLFGLILGVVLGRVG